MGHAKKGPLPVATGAGLEGNDYDTKLRTQYSAREDVTQLMHETQKAVAAALAAAERLAVLIAKAVRP